MTYIGKCPHCGTHLKEGHGLPWKRIGSPIKTCHRCKNTYFDSNMYEWALVGTIYKFIFIFLANNRWAPYLIFLMVLYRNWIIAVGGAVLWAVFCFVWFKTTKSEDVSLSKKRCLSQLKYIDLLLQKDDKLDVKKCETFKKMAKQIQEEKESAKKWQKSLIEEQATKNRCRNCGC